MKRVSTELHETAGSPRAWWVVVMMTGALVQAADVDAQWVQKNFDTASDAGVEPPYDAQQAFDAKFDAQSLEVVRRAQRVEVIRLANDARRERVTAVADGGVESLEGFVVSRRVVITDATLVERLKALTLDPEGYRWYGALRGNTIATKMCGGFQPKVVFRFGDDPLQSVDVLLCFNCRDLAVRSYGKFTFRTSRLVPQLADMGMPSEWLALEKAALPDDEFIQRETLCDPTPRSWARDGVYPPPWSPDGGPF